MAFKTSDIPSIPVILVIAGIAFIMLGISGGIEGIYSINVPSGRQPILVGTGVILIVLGLCLPPLQKKIVEGFGQTGDADLREAERIAKDFIKGKVKGSKIKISKTECKRGICKIEGTASSPSSEVKNFTVKIDSKTKNVKDYAIEDSPWSV